MLKQPKPAAGVSVFVKNQAVAPHGKVHSFTLLPSFPHQIIVSNIVFYEELHRGV